jgi:glucose-6-phosphate dehydrogenase assembly protein OpcA
VADLAWTRLTRWRQLVAQIFDKPENRERLPRIANARVTYVGAAVPLEGYYFAAWLQAGLPDAAISLERAEGEGCHLARVEFDSGETPIAIGLSQGQAAEMRMDGFVSKSICPEPSDYLLLREELGIEGADPVYARALRAAAELAAASSQ